ncbi:MAG: 2Fe-2S iron-sulfur cluster-binding protein [Candidatus Omnitrophica bacterium]|nr:2Fe-2S iron-sulfur cluster-binding protein [Candidatus Omnitrophota bacterium]
MMINIEIDGKKVKVRENSYILEVARKLGIEIPAICWHPGLEPYGACRLCLVEVEKSGRKRMVTSCNYPVEEGLIIKTNTHDVLRTRRIIIELLLARCSSNKKIVELAEKFGVSGSRFGYGNDDCILCGLCVRVCKDIIKKEAIGFSGRGISRKVSSPFEKTPEECIGCGSCAYVCPTGAIKIIDTEKSRKIEGINCEIPFVFCRYCGAPVAPLKQIESLKVKTNLPDDIFETCTECKNKSYALKIMAQAKLGSKR